MNFELAELIRLNNIDEEVLYNALHEDILESILSEICEYMKNDPISLRKIYFRNQKDIDTITQIVQNICHLSLPEKDLVRLNDCVKAFMQKKPQRNPIPDSIRQSLWVAQEQKCHICGKTIPVEEGHVDHIIPWDYVGDELDNNYQVLCSNCNLHKSNHVALTVHSLIFKRV